MAKVASLFSSIRKYTKECIFIVNDYTPIVVGCGRNEC
jgi:hypothetical protein